MDIDELRNELEIALLVWDAHARHWEDYNIPDIGMFNKIHSVLTVAFRPLLVDWNAFPDVTIYLRSSLLVLEQVTRAGVNVPFPLDFSGHMHAVITNTCEVYMNLFYTSIKEKIDFLTKKIVLIQRTWKKRISNPAYKVCRRRIMREYQTDMTTSVTRVFTDGACSDNGRKGAKAAWAAVFPSFPDLDCAGRLEGEQTNNRAEFMAAIKALEVSDGPIHIFTDSQLLIKIATRQWKAKMNLDMVEQIERLTREREVTWTHVRAHTGKTDEISWWNAEADRRATDQLKHMI